MELKRLTERIWYSMYEEERDRPCLGYIKGDNWSLAVDAGHSAIHVKEFYELLEKENLPLPALTVITHWHWDHAFGMHSIAGLSVANQRTNQHLIAFADMVSREGTGKFFDLDPSIRKEYASGEPVVIVPADIVFESSLCLDPGNITVRLSTCTSPHTDDTTLVYIPEEKTVFLGDCISGVFPTWERDPGKTRALVDTLKTFDADMFLGGHWDVLHKNELIEALVVTAGVSAAAGVGVTAGLSQ